MGGRHFPLRWLWVTCKKTGSRIKIQKRASGTTKMMRMLSSSRAFRTNSWMETLQMARRKTRTEQSTTVRIPCIVQVAVLYVRLCLQSQTLDDICLSTPDYLNAISWFDSQYQVCREILTRNSLFCYNFTVSTLHYLVILFSEIMDLTLLCHLTSVPMGTARIRADGMLALHLTTQGVQIKVEFEYWGRYQITVFLSIQSNPWNQVKKCKSKL